MTECDYYLGPTVEHVVEGEWFGGVGVLVAEGIGEYELRVLAGLEGNLVDVCGKEV